jgi:hypothetical protein
MPRQPKLIKTMMMITPPPPNRFGKGNALDLYSEGAGLNLSHNTSNPEIIHVFIHPSR